MSGTARLLRAPYNPRGPLAVQQLTLPLTGPPGRARRVLAGTHAQQPGPGGPVRALRCPPGGTPPSETHTVCSLNCLVRHCCSHKIHTLYQRLTFHLLSLRSNTDSVFLSSKGTAGRPGTGHCEVLDNWRSTVLRARKGPPLGDKPGSSPQQAGGGGLGGEPEGDQRSNLCRESRSTRQASGPQSGRTGTTRTP